MLGFYGIKICHYSINPSEGNMYCSSVVSILKHTRPRYTTYFSRNLQPAYLESYCRVTPLVCFRMPCIATRHDRVDTLPSDFTIYVIATDFILLSARLKIIIVFFQGLVPWAFALIKHCYQSKNTLYSLR
jgi:hypothetical protein